MRNLSDDILRKYLTGECSNDDFSEVNSWLKESEENAKRLFRMEEIYHLGKSYEDADRKRTEQAERRLFKRIEQEKQQESMQHSKMIRIHTRNLWMKYAAAIAVILMVAGGIGVWYQDAELGHEMMLASASEGIVKEVVLPDGTKVWLNSEATLKYPSEFSEKERNVHLTGEAYFEVTKNTQKPFIVESNTMRVRVLGTKFNFKSDEQSRVTEATLLEGEIEVKGNNEEGMIILSPGQRAELNKSTKRLTVKQVDAKLDAVWHNDLIPFEQADIFDISKTLERFYDVKIILSPDIRSDKTYSGVLKKKSTIESVLSSLQNSIPIQYKIVGNNIFISSRDK